MPDQVATTGEGPAIGFTKKFLVPGGTGAAGIELPVAKDPRVAAALAGDTPFPDGSFDLAQFTVNAEAKKPIQFGDGRGQVTFSGSANAFAGLGVFRESRGVLDALPLEDSIEQSIALESPGADDMYVLMRWGYDLAGAAKGAMALGFGAKATFGVEARRDGVYAVIRRLPVTTGARSAVADVVRSWALPRQVNDVADLQPGTWIVAEVDGAFGAKLGAEFGYDFNWMRETKLGALKQDIGLRLQLRANAMLGFEASGKYAVIVSRASTSPADQRLRLRIVKQSKRGMSFAFNAAASVQGRLPDAPKTVDEFVMAVFDIHPSQLIDDLHAIEKWLGSDQPLSDALAGLGVDYARDLVKKITGIDPETEFDKARGKVHSLLAAWDALPERVSSTIWSLVAEKASDARVDLAKLREVTSAIANDAPGAFRSLVEKELADVDFFRTPVGRWLEAAAVNGILSVLTDAGAFTRLQGVAATTAKLLDPAQLAGLLENLQHELASRLGLDRIVEGVKATDFDKIDEWLKKKLSEFLDKRIDFSDLQQIRAAVADLLAKRNEFYEKALKALTHKYSFSFAAAYQKTTTRTALVDAEFDFAVNAAAARSMLAAALDGNFNELFTKPDAAVRLRPATLTHGIKRTEHVEFHLPNISRTVDRLNTALASVTAEDDDGRVLAYDLNASDLITEKNTRNSRLAVGAQLPVRRGTGVRVHSTESLSYAYAFRQAVKKMRSTDLRAQVQPYLETYFAQLFGGDSSPSTWIADLDKQIDQLEFNGTENFGNTLISLELALPAAVAGGWLNAPADKKAPAYMDMSRRIQTKLKELIPFYFFADVERLKTVGSAAPLLVYASIPPSSDIILSGQKLTINAEPPRGVHWDIEDGAKRGAMIMHPRAASHLTQSLQRCHDRLVAAGLKSTAGFYEVGQLPTVRATSVNSANAGKLESLLRLEVGIITAAHEAGLKMAAFRERSFDDPEGAIAALAEFGSRITETFNSRVKSIYGGDALRPLGTMLFIEAARAFLPQSAQGVGPSALFELTVVKQASAFELGTFLDGKRPPADDVVVQERLARI